MLALAFVDVLPFTACVEGIADCAAVAEAALTTPPPESLGWLEYGSCATRIVSEKPVFCGEVGGEEIDEELWSEARSSTCILLPEACGISITVLEEKHAKEVILIYARHQ